jgi:hypothetical protein
MRPPRIGSWQVVSRETVVRGGAITSVIGGALRAAASFAPAAIASATAREWLYLGVDVFLGISLLGFYAIRRLRRTGVGGLTLAVAGIAAVRLDQLTAAGLYPVAALATAIGLVALSCSLWISHEIAGWLPLAFALSLSLGIGGTATPDSDAMLVASGVIFGAAFAALGWSIARRCAPPPTGGNYRAARP